MTIASSISLVSPRDDAGEARPLRILIVDDDRTLREGCANILRLDGHDVAYMDRHKELDAVHRDSNGRAAGVAHGADGGPPG